MANINVVSDVPETIDYPVVRKIGFDDLKDAVRKGVDDFVAMPTHVGFLTIIYPLVGLFLARLAFGYDTLPLLFPIVAGYALIGPFAAIGLYELSRRREQGEVVSWKNAFDVLKRPTLDAIAAIGFILMVVFVLWLATAQWLWTSLFGAVTPDTISEVTNAAFGTSKGLSLIVAGHALGFLFAVASLMIGVVSFPLLLDRDVSAWVAIQTSFRAVLENPAVMAAWGFLVAAALAIGSLPFFIGLAVVIPALAHISWHLYRKVVAPSGTPGFN